MWKCAKNVELVIKYVGNMFLRYMYCDEIQLEADTVLATLYVAKKYIVPHLARACVNYLETSLTAKNACLLLSQSRLFEEPDLMQRCWEVIDAQVSENRRILRSLGLSESDTDSSTDEPPRRVYRTLSSGEGSLSPCDLYDKKNLHHHHNQQQIYKALLIRAKTGEGNRQAECNAGGLRIVPYSLSLSESDCLPSIHALNGSIDNRRQIFSLIRTRSEPYFADDRLGIEITQNVTYTDSYPDNYQSNENNINLDTDCCDNDCDDFSRRT